MTILTKAQQRNREKLKADRAFLRDHYEKSTSGRDYQRSKVYKAEDVLKKFEGPLMETTKDVKAWIKEKLLPLLKDYDIRTVIVEDGRGSRRARACHDRRTIKMPKWSRKDWVIIHEVAHLPTHDHHGPMFCALYLRLVREVMGQEAGDALEKSFEEHGVHH